jgi:hypothetical protein
VAGPLPAYDMLTNLEYMLPVLKAMKIPVPVSLFLALVEAQRK